MDETGAINKIDEFFFSLLPQVSVLLTAAIGVDRLLPLLHVRAEIKANGNLKASLGGRCLHLVHKRPNIHRSLILCQQDNAKSC